MVQAASDYPEGRTGVRVSVYVGGGLMRLGLPPVPQVVVVVELEVRELLVVDVVDVVL